MKTKVIIPLIAVCLLCGCSDVNYIYRKEADSTVNLRLCWNWSDSGTKSETFTEIVDLYSNKTPSVNIESEYYKDDTFYQKLQVDFSSGNPPDIISARFGNLISGLLGNGKLADLSGLYAQSDGYLTKLIESDAVNDLSAGGKIYGLPLERTYVYLYINNDIFNYCSAKVPETFAELDEAVAKIRANNIVPIAFDASSDKYLYQAIVSRISESMSDNGKVSESAYVEGLDYIKHLYGIGAFSSNCMLSSEEQQNSLFLDKKAAMIVRDSGFINIMSAYNPDNSLSGTSSTAPFTVISFPQKNEIKSGDYSIVLNSYLSTFGDLTFYVSADCYKNEFKKKAANGFLSYLTNETNIDLMLQNGMILSTVTHGKISETLSPLATQMKLNIISAHDITQMPGIIAPENIWSRDITEKMIPLFQGETTAKIMTDNLFSDIK